MIKKNKIIFELNEFSIDLLRRYKLTHKNIKKILGWHLVKTNIPDNYESDFLEPWSQWVSIHTGLSCKKHQVKHLGDVDQLKELQAWDVRPEKFGVVWGCLNSKGATNKSVMYFPDPWTKKSCTNIAGAKSLQNFMRLAVSGRGSNLLSRIKILSSLFISVIFALPLISKNIDKDMLKILKKYSLKKILNTSVIYSFIEYIAFNFFLKLSKKNSIHTDIFFSNMLAHVQHYYWDTKNHYRIDLTIDLIDLMLGKLIKDYKKIYLINGLTQEYSADIEKWHSYIPRDGWISFVKEKISNKCTIEPCMSYDANLTFSSATELDKALHIIENIRIVNAKKSIFLTEINKKQPLKLFVRLNYYGHSNVSVLVYKKTYNFNDIFSLSAIRTARHMQLCYLIANQKSIKNIKLIHNYDLFKIYG